MDKKSDVEKANWCAINKFLEISRTISENIRNLTFDQKKDLVLSLAEIAKTCAIMCRNIMVRKVSKQLKINELNLRKAEKGKYLKELEEAKNAYSEFEYYKLHKAVNKEISSFESEIKKLNKDISRLDEEFSVYSSALEQCKEMARKLKFFLSV